MSIKMDVLKEIRLKNNLSQSEVGKLLNVSKSYISKIENGGGQYSVSQIQLLMKKYNINILQIKDGSVLEVNEHYCKGALKENLNEENYFVGDNLNDLVTIIKEYKNLTQESLANLMHVSQNTISSWQNFERKIDIDMFSLMLTKCNLINCYILQDEIMVLKPYEDVELEKSELYELAKVVCRYGSKGTNRIFSDVFMYIDDCAINSKLRPFDEVFCAKTELECAYKFVDLYPKGCLFNIKQAGVLEKNADMNDFYRLIYENPSLVMEELLVDCYILDNCEYVGEGFYLVFGDGGHCFSKLSTFLEYARSGKLDNILGCPENGNGLEDDIELVNKVYNGILKSIC